MISADPVKIEIIREGSVPKPLAGGSKVDYRVDSPRDSCSPEPRDDDGSRDFGQTGRLSKRKLQGTRQTRFAHRYGYRGQGTGAPEAGPATRANPRPRPSVFTPPRTVRPHAVAWPALAGTCAPGPGRRPPAAAARGSAARAGAPPREGGGCRTPRRKGWVRRGRRGTGRRPPGRKACRRPTRRAGRTRPRGRGLALPARDPDRRTPIRNLSDVSLPTAAARPGAAGVRGALGIRGIRESHGVRAVSRVRGIRRLRVPGIPGHRTRSRIGSLVGCLVVRLAPLPPQAKVTGSSVAGRVPGSLAGRVPQRPGA